jgi:hypothetical protein
MSILGKDYENNKNVQLHLDTHGIITRKLAHERSNARCFAKAGYTSNSSTDYNVFTIFNKANSGKKIGIYHIDFNINTTGLTGDDVILFVGLISAYSGGISANNTAYNLKAGHNASSNDVELIKNGFSVTDIGKIYLNKYKSTSTTTDNEKIIHVEFYNEYIELNPSTGLYLGYIGNNNNVNLHISYNIRFVEVEEGDSI